jgi:selenide,water dikinase
MMNPDMNHSEPIRLTQTVQKGGCAAKVAATELRKILGQVRFPPKDSNVLVDGGLFDDAAIYQISPEVALVQTLDFFTPILDTPSKFGRVAAANALSDVYAMGGVPKTAMAILAFPIATFSNDIVVEILQGASDVMAEAGVNFVGGHSIDDETLKFGLSVTGLVHPQKVWSNSRAESGHMLILTKALGTGTLSAALKKGEITETDMADAVDSMALINNITSVLSAGEMDSVAAATDITGFGFLGHSLQMARASKVDFEINFAALPYFKRSVECLEKGFLTKAHRTNRQYVESSLQWDSLTEMQKLLLVDPQTSGGLLLSVKAPEAVTVLAKLKTRFPATAIVGSVVATQSAEPQIRFI